MKSLNILGIIFSLVLIAISLNYIGDVLLARRANSLWDLQLDLVR